MRKKIQMTKQFNDLFTEFLTYIEKLFKKIGDSSDVLKIRVLKNKMEIAKKADSKIISKNFWYYLKDHTEQINNRDEKYFLEEDLLSFGLEHNDHETKKDSIKLRTLWASNKITETMKEDIWTIFQTLLSLSQQLNE